jgi:putative ABC transport system permease protein
MLSDSDLKRLAGVSGISSVRPNLSVNLQYLTRDGQKKYVGTMQTFNAYKKPELLAGAIPTHLADDTIILPEGYISALGFESGKQAIGKTIRLAVSKPTDRSSLLEAFSRGDTAALNDRSSTVEKIVTIVAVTKKPSTLVQPGTELYLYANDATVASLNDITTQGSANYHKYLTTFVKVADGTNKSKLNAAQSSIKSLGYGAQSVVDTQKTLTQIITVLQGIVLVFGLIAVVASVFGVVNTMYISVLQRTREIGLMKALGMHKKDISSLFRYEAALIGFLGGILGSGVAVVLGITLNPILSKQLGLGTQNLLDFRFSQISLLVLALVVIAILAGLLPARKAAQLDPIAALRTE